MKLEGEGDVCLCWDRERERGRERKREGARASCGSVKDAGPGSLAATQPSNPGKRLCGVGWGWLVGGGWAVTCTLTNGSNYTYHYDKNIVIL